MSTDPKLQATLDKAQMESATLDAVEPAAGFAALLNVLRATHVLSEVEVEKVLALRDTYADQFLEVHQKLLLITAQCKTPEDIVVGIEAIAGNLRRMEAQNLMSSRRVVSFQKHLDMVRAAMQRKVEEAGKEAGK